VTSPLIKRGSLDRDVSTGEMPFKDEGRSQPDASLAGVLQEAWRVFLTVLRRIQCPQHPDLRQPASRSVRKRIAVV
jgi:hypothetical protein